VKVLKFLLSFLLRRRKFLFSIIIYRERQRMSLVTQKLINSFSDYECYTNVLCSFNDALPILYSRRLTFYRYKPLYQLQFSPLPSHLIWSGEMTSSVNICSCKEDLEPARLAKTRQSYQGIMHNPSRVILDASLIKLIRLLSCTTLNLTDWWPQVESCLNSYIKSHSRNSFIDNLQHKQIYDLT